MICGRNHGASHICLHRAVHQGKPNSVIVVVSARIHRVPMAPSVIVAPSTPCCVAASVCTACVVVVPYSHRAVCACALRKLILSVVTPTVAVGAAGTATCSTKLIGGGGGGRGGTATCSITLTTIGGAALTGGGGGCAAAARHMSTKCRAPSSSLTMVAKPSTRHHSTEP